MKNIIEKIKYWFHENPMIYEIIKFIIDLIDLLS